MSNAITYKDRLTEAMTWLGTHNNLRVIGYNVTKPGGAAGGTFNGIPESQRIEMPLAECNMAGVAIGMSLAGFAPVLHLERFDFIYHSLDALANHLDKMSELSGGMHRPAMIIRVNIGKRATPLFTEPTHCQDLTQPMRDILPTVRIAKLMWKESIVGEYQRAWRDLSERKSTMLVEDADLLNT